MEEINYTLEDGLEGNDFSEISNDDVECNIIQMAEHEPEEDAFDCFLDNRYSTPLTKENSLEFIYDLQLKEEGCNKFRLKRGPDRETSMDRIKRTLEKDRKRVEQDGVALMSQL